MTLREEYPDLFKTCEISIGPGWEPIVSTVCALIKNMQRYGELPVDFKIIQVKEKFGELRIYHTPVLDTAMLRGIILMAEHVSMTVCETCGNRGELRGNRRWVKTLCDEHSKEE